MCQTYFFPNKFSLKAFSIKKIVNAFHYRNELESLALREISLHIETEEYKREIMITELEKLIVWKNKALSTTLFR